MKIKKEFVEIKIEATHGITNSQLSAWQECLNKFSAQVESDPTDSARVLKDAVKQAEYDQCHECGERNFERFVNKVNVTSGYYFKAGVLKERPPRDNKGTHSRTSKLRCSKCKTIYTQKERKEGI